MVVEKKNDILTRLCVVCRKKKNKSCLIRVVKQKNGKIFVDEAGKAEGKRAYRKIGK